MVICYAGATLPAIDKVLRTIKYTEDATAEPATQNMYMLCDMTMALANAIVERHCPGSAAQGRFPAGVPLPKSFFRQLDRTMIKGARLVFRLGHAADAGVGWTVGGCNDWHMRKKSLL